eukprot:TRINITY_DN15553_c3_g1_i1.p1 TRINITY_DN15553_c3_g1~~TRINITY_DN15553_c3_g1_i1.p1  ORF type:complete len:278 (+),score=80.52 TRINITY_DN15553_c3_g1_i1:92-925(+)
MLVNRQRQPFAWSESRPDGRRHIRSHHQAHGRAVRGARKVIDTSPPRCFRTRLAREKRDRTGPGGADAQPGAPGAGAGAPLPGSLLQQGPLLQQGFHPALLPTPYSNTSVSADDYERLLRGASAGYAAPSPTADTLPPRPASAPLGGRRPPPPPPPAGAWAGAATLRPTVTARRGGPVPGARPSLDGAQRREPSELHAAEELPADLQLGPDPELSAAERAGADRIERLTLAFSDEQMDAFERFVGLLSQFPRHDMETIVGAAVQEADERQLLANYRS